MTYYFFKRILFSLLALFILMSIIFFLLAVIPNIPLIRSQGESQEEFNMRITAAGFDLPVIERYFLYWNNFFQGNFGVIFNNESTRLTDLFFRNVPNTFYVAGIAFVLSVLIGFVLGTISALYRGKWQDTMINGLVVLFVSVPSFIVGILLLRLAGAIGLPQVFLNFSSPIFNFQTFVLSSIMPILSLTFGLGSTLTYYIRNELVEVLQQEYIKTALSKGLSKSAVVFKHALRNALIPAFSIIAPSFLFVITGSIVLERIFQVQGLASILFDGLLNNQFNLILFQTFFVTGLYFLIVILVDISFTIIDPRIKLAQAGQFTIWNILWNKSKRLLWEQRFKSAQNENHMQVDVNSSLYNVLKETKALNEKTNKVVVGNKLAKTYQIKANIKYLVIGKNIFKVQRKQTNATS